MSLATEEAQSALTELEGNSRMRLTRVMGGFCAIVLCAATIPLSRLVESTLKGDLTVRDARPWLFLGADTPLQLVFWTILACVAWLVLAVVVARLTARRNVQRSYVVEVESGTGAAKGIYAYVAGAVTLAVASLLVVARQSVVVGGKRVWFLDDDGMISMRYAYNLAHGHGLVWNAGQRVEGFTNPGWTAIMALINWVVPNVGLASLPMLIVSVVLLAGTAYMVARIAHERFGLSSGHSAVAAVLSTLAPPALAWATLGFEVAPLSFNLALAVWLLLHDGFTQNVRWKTVVAVALLGIWRADSVVLAAIVVVAAAATSDLSSAYRKSLLLRCGAAIGFVTVSIFALRWWYYGQLIPNTAVLKTSNFHGRVFVGTAYVVVSLVAYLPLLYVGTVAIRRPLNDATRLVLLGAASTLAYVAFEGGDVFPDRRVFAFWFPLLIVVLYAAAVKGLRGRRVSYAAVVVALALLVSPDTVAYVRALKHPDGTAEAVRAGLAMKSQLPPGRVAVFYAGAPIYFSGFEGVDLLGKMDPHIARESVKGVIPGHNKYDIDWSLSNYHPAYLLADSNISPSSSEIARLKRGEFGFNGDLWSSEEFLGHCANHPDPAVSTSLILYRCSW